MIPSILIFFATLMRLLPHPANFTPMGATALFGGVHLQKRYALIIPMMALILSDMFIGFDSLESRLAVYGSFLLIGLLGLWARNHQSFGTIAGAAIAGPIIFFLITNFVFLYPPTLYPHTIEGMLQSYHNALPFLRNMMIGDLVYTGLLFGTYELAQYLSKKKPKTVTA